MRLLARNALAATAAAVAVDAPLLYAQVQQQPRTGTPPASQSGIPDLNAGKPEEDTPAIPMRERMRISAERAHAEDRRKRMLADTDKLLALSAELKADIEKTTRDELSLEVIRKAGEIEKLAHDVQQRMKN